MTKILANRNQVTEILLLKNIILNRRNFLELLNTKRKFIISFHYLEKRIATFTKIA